MITNKEKIEVMNAFEEGAKIESREYGDTLWEVVENPVWNWASHEYRVADQRFRAEIGEKYYHIIGLGSVVRMEEQGTTLDEKRYNSGSYFETREQAEAVARKIREVMMEAHKQIKEAEGK